MKMTKQQKKKIGFALITLIFVAAFIGFVYYGATNFKVAKAKFSVDIESSPKIEDTLKEELIDASSKTLVDIVSGDPTDEVTIIVKAKDISDANVDVMFEKENLGIVTVTAEEAIKLAEDSNIEYLYADMEAELYSSMPTSLGYLKSTPMSPSVGAGTKVCILDTGIYAEHSWFRGVDIHEMNFMYGAETPGAEDDHGHGTHVAGIVISTAPGTELYIAKVCGSNGMCSFSDIMRAIDWCSTNDVDVVSMSLGSIRYSLPCDMYPISQQINSITETEGILFTMAGGNVDCGADCHDFKVAVPGCAEKGISVSALDINNDDATSITNPASYDMTNLHNICEGDTCYQYNPGISMIDIMANGKVESAWYKGRTKTVSMRGTSMATPHVAGAIALLKSISSASGETIRQALYDGATEGYAGNGLLNTAASCQVLLNEQPIPCDGYYSTQTSIKGTSKDWMRIQVDSNEQIWRRTGTRTVSERINGPGDPDPINYYKTSSTYRYYEVRQIYDNVFYIRRETSSRVTEEIHVWANDPVNQQNTKSTKRAYITRFQYLEPAKASTYMRRLKDSSELVFKPLDDCSSSSSQCHNYIKEASSYIGSYHDITYNDTILIKEPTKSSSSNNRQIGKGVIGISGSVSVA